MKIYTTVLEDAGYEEAVLGLGLSYRTPFTRSKEIAKELAFKDGGHNKFLESIYLWMLVKAPRYWWQEADTYRISTKQSESTMHTLVKDLKLCESIEDLIQWVQDNFEYPEHFNEDQMKTLWKFAKEDRVEELKSMLPEGFLQARMWVMSYKTMRNIILQRKNHRLPHWQIFIKDVLNQCDKPELLQEC